MTVRAPALVVVLALGGAFAPSSPRAAEPPADPGYPWTHDVRPVVWCDDDDFGRLLNPLCRASGVTVRYRTAPEPFDPARRLEFGERYDPDRYRECRRHAARNDMSCEVYRLRRHELPVHFPYPGVPLPRLPDPPADSGFRPGMSSEAYFEHLCRTEAGEFIYRTVEGVEGIFQMRPRVAASDMALRDRFVMSDPYSPIGEAFIDAPALLIGQGRYQYVESTHFQQFTTAHERRHFSSTMFEVDDADGSYVRFSGNGDSGRLDDLMKEWIPRLDSDYGFFWRDIRRPMDRQLGIAGSELIVVELRSNEVLGIWRRFIYAGGKRRVWWLGGVRCPASGREAYATFQFLSKVAQPIP